MNNLIFERHNPTERLEWLLQYLRAKWPATRFAITALTSHNWPNADQVAPTNQQYRALARRQGVPVFECMQVCGVGGRVPGRASGGTPGWGASPPAVPLPTPPRPPPALLPQDVEPWSSAHYDGLHFTAEGNELLAACLRRGVNKLLR